MRRKRSLDAEEQQLWQAVAQTITPLPRTLRAAPVQPLPEPVVTPSAPAQPRLPAFRLGEKSTAKPGLPVEPALRMDAKTHARMTRGKLAPEARIDLHGMTVAQAHAELIRFILNAQDAGFRLVLVITGKGGRPGQHDHEDTHRARGVLRQQVPHWLRLPPLGFAVQQVAEAHLRHGGSGACYVYLRRR